MREKHAGFQSGSVSWTLGLRACTGTPSSAKAPADHRSPTPLWSREDSNSGFLTSRCSGPAPLLPGRTPPPGARHRPGGQGLGAEHGEGLAQRVQGYCRLLPRAACCSKGPIIERGCREAKFQRRHMRVCDRTCSCRRAAASNSGIFLQMWTASRSGFGRTRP